MSRTNTEDMPQQPLDSALPSPQKLWEGKTTSAIERLCRVVLCYRWTLQSGAKNWEAIEQIVYEVVEGRDAMGQNIWEQHGIQDCPAQFFLDCCGVRDGSQ